MKDGHHRAKSKGPPRSEAPRSPCSADTPVRVLIATKLQPLWRAMVAPSRVGQGKPRRVVEADVVGTGRPLALGFNRLNHAGLHDCRGDQQRQLTVADARARITAKSLGVSVSIVRAVICWVLIAMTPAAMLGTDGEAGGAMLYGQGTVWLNDKPLPRSSAVFPGDVIQTQQESVATLDAPGSGVVVLPDSRVKLQENAISLERGSVSVATSKGMVALAQKVIVTPASNSWTEFEMRDTNGAVEVVASQGSVNVNCGKGTANLSPGDVVTPDESGNCNKKRRKGGTPFPVKGGILTNPFVVAGELITAGGVVCLLLCNHSKDFLSPWKP